MKLRLLECFLAWHNGRIAATMVLTMSAKGKIPVLTLTHLLMDPLILDPYILLLIYNYLLNHGATIEIFENTGQKGHT